MKRRRFAFAAAFTIAIAAIAVTNGGAGNEPGFDTARPAQLVPEPGSGTIVDPILSTGDIVGTYQMSGVPDGLGAYKDNHNNVVVLMNHELGRTFPALPPGVDARISKVVINGKNRDVQEAHYAFTGAEGFERFCSSTLEVIEGTPWYFTGEEAIGVSPLVGHDGSSIVMNAETGVPQETPHFGHMNHENVVPVERIRKFILVTTDDDFRTVSRPICSRISRIRLRRPFPAIRAGAASMSGGRRTPLSSTSSKARRSRASSFRSHRPRTRTRPS
jgi:hypothetical protein